MITFLTRRTRNLADSDNCNQWNLWIPTKISEYVSPINFTKPTFFREIWKISLLTDAAEKLFACPGDFFVRQSTVHWNVIWCIRFVWLAKCTWPNSPRFVSVVGGGRKMKDVLTNLQRVWLFSYLEIILCVFLILIF